MVDNEKQHILSLSYGKDSLACLGAIEKLGWKLDRIIHAEVWATNTLSADLPPMVEFKEKADKIIKDRWGIQVEHIRGKYTYEDYFYKKYIRGTHIGNIYGFPSMKGAWCNSKLKVEVLKKAEGKGNKIYLGIARDEPIRLSRLKENEFSPLAEIGWTESDCNKWCKENDLLSPIYTTSERGGCWFCHNQRVEQLRKLRHTYPEYWKLLLKWDKDSPVTFKPDGHTVRDFDKRFEMEDKGLIGTTKFHWEDIDDTQIKFDL